MKQIRIALSSRDTHDHWGTEVMKIRILATLAASAMAIALPSVASAQGTPVLDIKASIASVKELEQLRQAVAKAEQLKGKVTDMSTSIGQIGKSSLGNMMSTAGFNFKSVAGGAKGVLSDVEDMGTQANTALTQAKGMKIPGEAMNFKVGDANNKLGLQDARTAAQQLFFYNGSEQMDQTKIAALRDRRNAMLRESAVSAYASSVATKSGGATAGTAADNLVAAVKDSPDLRGDVQANTGVLLAIYKEIVQQTALQTDAVGLAAAQTLATDPTGKAN
jgi:hypothetical protein